MQLPPLNALRAFEAAARTGSYVAAATELGVTPGAISQQVRLLEAHLGKALFQRFNNRIGLTDAGQAVFLGASDALQAIAALTEQVQTGRTRGRLTISMLPSVAECWLVPRLTEFAARHPDLRFDLQVADDPVDFARDGIDLRLGYGSDAYPGLPGRVLVRDAVLPLAAPSYLARHPGGLGSVPDADLIHTNWGPSFASHPGWAAWAEANGRPRPDAATGHRVGRSALALDLARQGLGVALGQRLLAADDRRAGRLVALSDAALPLGHPYVLVHPPGRARRPALRALIDWLVEAAGCSPTR